MKWKIYIICHKFIINRFYTNDVEFNNENYCFINVSPNKLNPDYYNKYNIIDQSSLPEYKSLGKYFAESEAIYNVYVNDLCKDLDYVGFLHWDKEFKIIEDGSTNITNIINKFINNNIDHISLETHNCKRDYGQGILADKNRPNDLTGNGLNCYDYILNDYNNFFKTNYKITDFFSKEKINLCSCFLVKKEIFEKMMKFICDKIHSKELDIFDTNHINRLQGGLLERYYGLFLCFETNNMKECNLYHQYNMKNIQ